MLPGLAPASSAMSRIDTALKPWVENNSSAALRMASRILGFRVIGFAFCSLVLYVCTNYKVRSTNIWLKATCRPPDRNNKGERPDAPDRRCVSHHRRIAVLARCAHGHRGRSGPAADTSAVRRAEGGPLSGNP